VFYLKHFVVEEVRVSDDDWWGFTEIQGEYCRFFGARHGETGVGKFLSYGWDLCLWGEKAWVLNRSLLLESVGLNRISLENACVACIGELPSMLFFFIFFLFCL
jgi:hypothetical protein